MAIRLEKGQRINLEKDNGAKLTSFCVGCNWGAIVIEKTGFLGFGTKKEEAIRVYSNISFCICQCLFPCIIFRNHFFVRVCHL